MEQSAEILRSIAVISGKGGSGKTMIAAVMTNILSELFPGVNVIVMDGDTGTAGLTYYLGLKLVSNIRVGLSNYEPNAPEEVLRGYWKKSLQPIKGLNGARLFGIGDHRRLEKVFPEEAFPKLLSEVVPRLQKGNWLVIDCRGGIDRESLAVCESVDDIIIIAESDTTSFQATKHVVDVLSDHDLAHKIRGFMINKVFDDPSVVVRNGTSVFGSQFLAAIPFDLKATRSFLVGDIPNLETPFGAHVWLALHKAYPEAIPPPVYRTWTFEEFREVGLTNLDSVRGGSVIAVFILLLLMFTIFNHYFGNQDVIPSNLLITVTGTLGLLACFEGVRRAFGQIVSSYMYASGRLFNLLQKMFVAKRKY
jgi:septum site-determining protein MinD